MRNIGLKGLLRYASCVALLLLCDAHAVTAKAEKVNASKRSAFSKNIFNPSKKRVGSLGDHELENLLSQGGGSATGTRTNWDFASSGCVANDNIDTPAFIIDGSGCGGTISVDDIVHVRACSLDMTVFVTTPTTLQASDDDAAIIIEAGLGRTITFNLLSSLTFSGSGTDPLLIVLRGPGTIIFSIDDNESLNFGPANSLAPGIGVQTYIIMEDPDVAGATPTVIIQRVSSSSVAPVDITIGQDSFITFAACTNILNDPAEEARLLFDPSNDDVGRMVLTIHDGNVDDGNGGGNLNISGRLMVAGINGDPCPLGDVCSSPFDFGVDNFDRSTLAGLSAFVGVVGTSGIVPTIAGRMLFINDNSQSFEFQSDPWCTLGTRSNEDGIGCFTGVQYGFVLGANGVLAIDDDQTFDYVGLANNVCPEPTDSICEEVTPLPVTCSESEGCTVPTAIPIAARIKPRNYSAFIVDGFNNPNPDEIIVPNAAIVMCECSAMVFRSGVDCCGNVQNGRDDADCSTEFVVSPNKISPGAGEIVFDIEGLLDVVSFDVLPGCGFFQPCELSPDPCGIPQQAWSAKIELLSLHICRTGCRLLVGHTCCLEPDFPSRDFATDLNGDLLRYNKGQFFINNRVNLQGIALVHTDQNHLVVEKNDVISEATYVGGESWTFCGNSERPAIAFYNSAFFVHTNVALTGVDLLVPNDNVGMLGHSGFPQFVCDEVLVRQPSPDPIPCCDNQSTFIFFQNGNLIDHGIGRQMILGTRVGALACDDCTVVNADSHIDVKQENPCTGDAADILHQLLLQTWPNNGCVNEGLFNGEVAPPGADIATQPSLHTIYLGHSSNISIGADANDLSIMGPDNLTFPQLIIQGNFFAFATRGGGQASPELSSATGQGGIFVDFNGEICVAPTARVAMGDMVTKSFNGEVNLPAGQVRFAPRLGIENWQLNLADCDLRFVDCNDIAEVVVVGDGQNLSNYTLNWLLTQKNYIGGLANPACENPDLEGFLPYVITCYNPCSSPAVIRENVQFLPTIRGSVDTLQIRGSSLGDEAHVAIRGCGEVHNLVNVLGCNSGEMPSTVVVLGDSATVGLGGVTLGANGVTIIADGPDVTVHLNDDIIIDNIAAILKGPNFCSGCDIGTEECIIRFESDCCRSIRVKQSGILDLSSFDDVNQVVEFGGNIRLILEPGATIAWGGQNPESEGGTLRFVDEAQLIAESFDCAESLFENNPSSINLTDGIRAKLVGNGQLVLDGCASFVIQEDAFVGVETLTATVQQLACGVQSSCQVLFTNLSLELRDQSSFFIGNGCRQPGGSFQVGNTTDQSPDALINFSLTLAGQDTVIAIGSKGFAGFGVGIASKLGVVNDWLVNTLFNLGSVTLEWTNGTFRHDRIYDGDDERASLLALSQGTSVNAAVYNFNVIPDVDEDDTNISQTTIQGGGNLILVQPTGGSDLSPAVTNVNGVVVVNRLNVGILASLPLMPQEIIAVPFIGTADGLMAIIRARDTASFATNPEAGLTNVAKSNLHYRALVDYVAGTAPAASTIVRDEVTEVKGPGGATLTLLQATNIGAARVLLDPNNPLIINQVRVLP